MAEIKVIIVEDNHTIRSGLEMLIQGTQGYECLKTYRDGESFVKDLDDYDPHVILMDIKLPGISGIDCIKEAKKRKPNVNILMLTVYEDNKHVFEALCMGACGYLVKNTPPSRLLDAIKDAREGGSPMTSRIARKVIDILHQNKKNEMNDEFKLSSREKEVLQGLVDGKCYKAIADLLCISVDTVRHHIRNIYKKLHVHSQTEAVVKAIRKGLI